MLVCWVTRCASRLIRDPYGDGRITYPADDFVVGVHLATEFWMREGCQPKGIRRQRPTKRENVTTKTHPSSADRALQSRACFREPSTSPRASVLSVPPPLAPVLCRLSLSSSVTGSRLLCPCRSRWAGHSRLLQKCDSGQISAGLSRTATRYSRWTGTPKR